ncbi:MAG: ABC transporter substrate-binding protein [Lachnospiraceae bacterium]|nr:ABC transporter substrate-binding protein [Lachnospiraceae bacterium]
MMKKGWLVSLAVLVLSLCCLTGCGAKEKLKIYLPGEYMSDELVPNFEKQYNCKVDVELFDSNEMMYTKVMAGDSYDVLIPSDYMIERLIKEDYLQKIDVSKLSNFGSVTDALKVAPYNGFDPDNSYSVPYFWGSVGIVYNQNNVPTSEVEAKGFEIMKDTKYAGKIYMYDSERDSFMIAFKSLGYSMNTNEESEIMAAYDWLVELNTTMDPTTVTDEVIDGMAQGRKDLAIVYSGDAAYILSENEDMRYYTPECGTNVWVDAMVIPKNAKNVDLAYKFIDYVISYDAAMGNTEAVGYASVNKDVLAEVTADGGLYDGNEAYIPRTGFAKDEVFTDNEFLRKKLSELWIKVKASK